MHINATPHQLTHTFETRFFSLFSRNNAKQRYQRKYAHIYLQICSQIMHFTAFAKSHFLNSFCAYTKDIHPSHSSATHYSLYPSSLNSKNQLEKRAFRLKCEKLAHKIFQVRNLCSKWEMLNDQSRKIYAPQQWVMLWIIVAITVLEMYIAFFSGEARRWFTENFETDRSVCFRKWSGKYSYIKYLWVRCIWHGPGFTVF